MHYFILQNSVISKYRYSQSKDPSVANLAKDLVEKWKNDIKSEGKKAGPTTEASSTIEKLPPPQPKKQVRDADEDYSHYEAKEDIKQVDDPDIENYSEFMSKNYTDDKVRKNIREAIVKELKKFDSKSTKLIDILSVKIEIGLIKAYSTIPKDYSNKARSVLANLKRSDQFKRRIIEGDIKPEDIATMDAKDMQDSEIIKKLEEQEKSIIDSKRSDFMLANMTVKEGMYTCKKCKGKKTTFYEQQTRSCDEPMTVFVQCIDCGHNMKF